MEDLYKKAIEIDAWREGYQEALEKAIVLIQESGRFGIDKAIEAIKKEHEFIVKGNP